jgi:hypothetical protein
MAVDYSPIRHGQTNNTGDARSLFLKLYAGEVLTAFQTRNVMMPLHRVRTISKGKSAQFPMTGKYRTATYHTPGHEIEPTTAKQGERVVSIDDLLINAQFIANIDEAMTHYDIRSIYTQEAGYALAKVADQNLLRTAIKAGLCDNSTVAETAGMIQDIGAGFDDEDFTDNVFIGGATDSSKTKVEDPKELAQAIIEARRILENAAVPGDPVVILPVDLYYNMFKVNSGSLNDLIIFNRDVGGGGSVVTGDVPMIMGMPLVTTPHMGSFAGKVWTPSLWTQSGGIGTGSIAVTTDDDPKSGESGRNGQYNVPLASTATASMGTDNLSDLATRVVGMVMTQDAIATVKLMDLAIESEYQVNRQGTLTVAKYAMGHNVLRPASCVLLLQGSAA